MTKRVGQLRAASFVAFAVGIFALLIGKDNLMVAAFVTAVVLVAASIYSNYLDR